MDYGTLAALKAAIQARIKENGVGGKNRAADFEQSYDDVADTLFARNDEKTTAISDLETDVAGIFTDIGTLETEVALKASEVYVNQQIASNDLVIQKSFGFEAGADTANVFAEANIIYTWPDPLNPPPGVSIVGMTIGQVTLKDTYFSLVRADATNRRLVQLIATIQA